MRPVSDAQDVIADNILERGEILLVSADIRPGRNGRAMRLAAELVNQRVCNRAPDLDKIGARLRLDRAFQTAGSLQYLRRALLPAQFTVAWL